MAGGDAVPIALQEEYERDFGLPLHEGFGMTESLPTFMNLPHCTRRGSLGKPLRGVLARVVDSEGRQLPDGSIGELTFQAPGLTIGYWRNPEATAAAIHDGWLHTGDLAWRDADGFLWFAGRQKDIIVRGGSNIAPQEAEAVLYEHPAVAECAVVGAPDEFWGEIVIAFVVLRPGKLASAEDLIRYTKIKMAEYKCPAHVEFLEQLPKGPTNKVLRRELRERVRATQRLLDRCAACNPDCPGGNTAAKLKARLRWSLWSNYRKATKEGLRRVA